MAASRTSAARPPAGGKAALSRSRHLPGKLAQRQGAAALTLVARPWAERRPAPVGLEREPERRQIGGDLVEHALQIGGLVDREVHRGLARAIAQQGLVPLDDADRVELDLARLDLVAK